jgi:hypothetical protein
MRSWTVRAICALSLVAPSAQAGEGAIEINQHCATVTGCLDGDSPGFPVSAIGGGSFVLTSSLTVADADTTAVIIGSGGLLDLNGFSITGPAVCTGTPPSCVGLGSGFGVHAYEGSVVRNGRIAGMGGDGVRTSNGATFEKLLVEANGADGMQVSSGSLIRDCRVLRNKDDGILVTVSEPVPILRSVIFGNGNRGVGNNALIVDSAIYGNAEVGFGATAEAGIGYGALWGNAGGSGQPQASGPFTEVGPNVCDGGACP